MLQVYEVSGAWGGSWGVGWSRGCLRSRRIGSSGIGGLGPFEVRRVSVGCEWFRLLRFPSLLDAYGDPCDVVVLGSRKRR